MDKMVRIGGFWLHVEGSAARHVSVAREVVRIVAMGAILGSVAFAVAYPFLYVWSCR